MNIYFVIMNESKIFKGPNPVTNKLYPVIKNRKTQDYLQKSEITKLDRIDFNVAAWIYFRHPKALYSYLEYIAPEYTENGIDLNIQVIYNELLTAFESLKENVH